MSFRPSSTLKRRKRQRLQKSSLSLETERFQLETMRFESIFEGLRFHQRFERFSVDDRRKRIKKCAYDFVSGPPGLTRCFFSSEYRAMLYSRLETQKKKRAREERQYKPPRAKRQKTHGEPKVNISNKGGSR